MTTETIIHTPSAVSHYFGTDQPFLVAFDSDPPVWTEITAPHEEVAALVFWERRPADYPTNTMLVYDPTFHVHREGFAAQILVETRGERAGEVAYITDIELDDTLPPPTAHGREGMG